MRRWLYVFGGAVVLLVSLTVFSGKKSEDAKQDAQWAVGEVQQTRQQTKQLEKALGKEQQKRAVAIIAAKKANVRADSAGRVAVRHDHRADSVIRVLVREQRAQQASAADTAPISRIQARLSNYRPQAYAIPGSIDSLK